MTETGSADPQLPSDPDELAGLTAAGRRKYLQAQKDLDQIIYVVCRELAVTAAYDTAAGGSPLTTAQVGHFLKGVLASAAAYAQYRDDPEEMTAMINRRLTTIEGDAVARLSTVARQLRRDNPWEPGWNTT